jgi:hypothetical protein
MTSLSLLAHSVVRGPARVNECFGYVSVSVRDGQPAPPVTAIDTADATVARFFGTLVRICRRVGAGASRPAC